MLRKEFIFLIFTIIAVSSCTQSEKIDITDLTGPIENIIQTQDDDAQFKEFIVGASGSIKPFADTTLFIKQPIDFVDGRRFYTENEELFTGTQEWRFQEDGYIYQFYEFKNGIQTKSIRFNGDGSEGFKWERYDQIGDTTYHRNFRDGKLYSTQKVWSFTEDSVTYVLTESNYYYTTETSSEIARTVSSQTKNYWIGTVYYSFYESLDSNGNSTNSESRRDDQANYLEYWSYKNDSLRTYRYKDNEMATTRIYYSNGSLWAEVNALNNGSDNYFGGDVIYHGEQISFKQNGELTKKEIWDNGELIEKIK